MKHASHFDGVLKIIANGETVPLNTVLYANGKGFTDIPVIKRQLLH